MSEESSLDSFAITMPQISRDADEIDVQQDCPLFLLSKELRDEIYKLVFADAIESSNDEPIDITRAVSPSDALMVTCFRLWLETAETWVKARRTYWSRNHFVVPLPLVYNEANIDASGAYLGSLGLRTEHFTLINKITFKVSGRDFEHTFRWGPSANLYAAITFMGGTFHWNEAPHRRLLLIKEEMLALGEAITKIVNERSKAGERRGQYVATTREYLKYVAKGRELNINEEGLEAKCEAAAEMFGGMAMADSIVLKRAILEGIVKHFGVRHQVQIRQV
jgi:hypothetical protein